MKIIQYSPLPRRGYITLRSIEIVISCQSENFKKKSIFTSRIIAFYLGDFEWWKKLRSFLCAKMHCWLSLITSWLTSTSTTYLGPLKNCCPKFLPGWSAKNSQKLCSLHSQLAKAAKKTNFKKNIWYLASKSFLIVHIMVNNE